MGDKHDMLQFAFSKAIVADYPVVLDMLETYFKNLYPYSQYKAVWHVLQSIKESQLLMKGQLKDYKRIYEKRGKTNE